MVARGAAVAEMMMDAEDEETGSGIVGLGDSRGTTTTTEDIARTASAEDQGQGQEQEEVES